jgi:hypothetical protein
MIATGGLGADWVDGFFGAGAGAFSASAMVEPTANAATKAATRAFRISVSAAPRRPARPDLDPGWPPVREKDMRRPTNLEHVSIPQERDVI